MEAAVAVASAEAEVAGSLRLLTIATKFAMTLPIEDRRAPPPVERLP